MFKNTTMPAIVNYNGFSHKGLHTQLNEDDDLIDQPNQIRIRMFNHQLRVVAQALKLESDDEFRSNIGVLCDKVGAGKSYEALAIAAYPIHNTCIMYGDNNIVSYKNIGHNGVNLFVVPHSLVSQWNKYCENTTFDICVIRKFKENIELKEITIVSNTAYKEFSIHAKEKKIIFKRIFYDECSTIKVPACIRLYSIFTWFITASIQDVQPNGFYANSKDFKISSRGFIFDTFIAIFKYKNKGKLFIKNEDESIDREMLLEAYKDVRIKCSNRVSYILEQAVSQEMLSMLHAGDTKSASLMFGSDYIDEAHLLEEVCSSMFLKLRQLKDKLDEIRERRYGSKETKNSAIERAMGKIKEMEQKIENVNQRMSDSNICPISYCEINVPCVVTCCHNKFEFEAIMMFMMSKPHIVCPFCRTPLTSSSIVVVNTNVGTEENDKYGDTGEWVTSDHTSVENVSHIINNLPNGSRVIVFSSYSNTFDAVEANYDIECLSRELKGNHMVQKNIIDWFNTKCDDKRVLSLNSRYIGAGINLHMATDVIITHDMNDALTRQCIGRAQRYGREGRLTVYTMIHEND